MKTRASSKDENECYSINEIIANSKKFSEDKIFEIIKSDPKDTRFKYVHLKVKHMKNLKRRCNYLEQDQG